MPSSAEIDERINIKLVATSGVAMNGRQIAKKSTAKLALSAIKACENGQVSDGESDRSSDEDSVDSVPNIPDMTLALKKNGFSRTARKSMKPSMVADQQIAAMKEKQGKGSSEDNNKNPLEDVNNSDKKSSIKLDDEGHCTNSIESLTKAVNETLDKNNSSDLELTDHSEKPLPVINKGFVKKITLTLKTAAQKLGLEKKVMQTLADGAKSKVSDLSPAATSPSNDQSKNLFETMENSRSRPETPVARTISQPGSPLEKSDNSGTDTSIGDCKSNVNETEKVPNEKIGNTYTDNMNKNSVNKEDAIMPIMDTSTEHKQNDTSATGTAEESEEVPMDVENELLGIDKDEESAVTVKVSATETAYFCHKGSSVDESNDATETHKSEENVVYTEDDKSGKDMVETEDVNKLDKNQAQIQDIKRERLASTESDDCEIQKYDSPVEDDSHDIILLSDSDEGEGKNSNKRKQKPGHIISTEVKTDNNKTDQSSSVLKRQHSSDLSDSEQKTKRSRLDELVGNLRNELSKPVSEDSQNSDCNSGSRKKRKTILTKEELGKLIEEKLPLVIKKHNDDMIKDLKNKIEDLRTANDKWRDTAKDLQKQVLELNVMLQNQAKLIPRKAAQKSALNKRTVCTQVDPETIATTMKAAMQSPSGGRPINSHLQQGVKPQATTQVQTKTNTVVASAVIDLTDDDDKKSAHKTSYPVKHLLESKRAKQTTATMVVRNTQPSTTVQSIKPAQMASTLSNTANMVRLVNQSRAAYSVPTQQVRYQIATPTSPRSNYVNVIPAQQQQHLHVIPTGPPALRPGTVVRLVQTTSNVVTRPPPPLQSAPQSNQPPPLPVSGQAPCIRHQILPKPELKISRVSQGIVLSWNMTVTEKHAEVNSYQLFAYQETNNASQSSTSWKKVGDVKALPLPMACTLTQFQEGNKYHFAVRAVDVHSCIGPFSSPTSIHLTTQ